jgi:hypothetical protein
MTETGVGTFGRLALWFAPNIIVAAGFFAVLRWLKPENPVVVQALTVVVGVFVLGYSLFLGKRESLRWDEVQRASQGFASANGWVWGGFATMLLLMVPPVMNWFIDLVNVLGTGSPDSTNRTAVRVAFFCGIALVMVMQTLGIIVFSVVWWRRMGGTGEQS